MAETGCAPELTAAEDLDATQYVQATTEAAARYATPAAAMAAGYLAASPTDYPVVDLREPDHRGGQRGGQAHARPGHIDGLVYAQTPSGTEVLAAAMYILPSTVLELPMPYGALVQWHQRTGCVRRPVTSSPTMPLDITGYTPCAERLTVTPTPYLTMVWQVPVAGGPLAIQPPDIQIVEAAVMQTLGPDGHRRRSAPLSGARWRRPAARTSALGRQAPAATLAAICSGLVAPAMTEATAGCESNQAEGQVEHGVPLAAGQRRRARPPWPAAPR